LMFWRLNPRVLLNQFRRRVRFAVQTAFEEDFGRSVFLPHWQPGIDISQKKEQFHQFALGTLY
jgi:hypothetical protein